MLRTAPSYLGKSFQRLEWRTCFLWRDYLVVGQAGEENSRAEDSAGRLAASTQAALIFCLWYQVLYGASLF